MPHFYFHLFNDFEVADNEGAFLSDLQAARIFAIGRARALIADTTVEHGRISLHHRIDIKDEQHALVDTVLFRDAVTVEA